MTFNCFSIKSFWFTVTGLMSSQAMDLVCGLTQKNAFFIPSCWIRIWLGYKWPTCDQWKCQLSPLHLGPFLIRAQSSFVRAWAYTDAFLPAWLTDLWLLKLQPFTRIQMVSSQAKYGPSLHLATDHWQQIWMNFNWKSWKMVSAESRVIYDMISLWFRGRPLQH